MTFSLLASLDRAQRPAASADFVRNGISYHIDFSMEADNDTVDATFTQSNGVVSYGKYKTSQLVPSAISMGSTFSVGRNAMGARHTMASTAGKVAAVAGLVAATSAAIAFFLPPAAPIAGGVAAVSGVVAAAAVVIDRSSQRNAKINGEIMNVGQHLTTWRLGSLGIILGIALLSNLYFRPYQWYNLVAIYALGLVLALCIALLIRRLISPQNRFH
ncbi:MAG: hypothetical protein ACXVAS_10870 [Vulcanimicrobiaceae bacterium]